MNTIQTIDTLEHFFFNVFGYKVDEMKVNKKIDVSLFNYGVLSYYNGEKCFKKVLSIIRKEQTIKYILSIIDKKIECSGDHKILIKHAINKEPLYVTIKEAMKLISFYILTEDLIWEVGNIEKTKEIIDILDMEIEDSHCYFSNGILSHNTIFGNPETTTGGNALKFYASIRLDVRRININKDGDEAKSNRTKVKVVKNKTFPPFKQCEFDIVYGVGIDSCGEVLDLAVEYDIIKKNGSWYSYQETRLGQGKDSVVSTLRDNPELVDELKEQVLKHLK